MGKDGSFYPYRLLVWFHTPSKFIESLATARSARMPSFLLFDVSCHPDPISGLEVYAYLTTSVTIHRTSIHCNVWLGQACRLSTMILALFPSAGFQKIIFPIVSGLEPVPLLFSLPVRIRVGSYPILSMSAPELQSEGSILVILFRT